MRPVVVRSDMSFVPSTGIDGQNELVRQFMAQWEKPGLIIDERFNNGGQIPDRFIELLNRKTTCLLGCSGWQRLAMATSGAFWAQGDDDQRMEWFRRGCIS